MEQFEKNMEHFEKKMEQFEKNMEHFENKKEHFEKKMEHFEKFWEIFIFFGILPTTLVFALSFATWTFWEKNGTFWEKKWNILRKKWNILRKKWNILRKIRVQPSQNSGRALCEKPYRSSPLFARLSKCEIFWEIPVSIWDGILFREQDALGVHLFFLFFSKL